MEHLTDDIPRLLTGDATRDEVLAAGEHLRSCPDCQQELVAAVIAHASLTSAHRFAPEVVAAVSGGPREESLPEGPLPDLSAVFARVRAEAAAQAPAAARRRHRLRVAVIAAAAAVVVGGTTIAVVEATSGSNPPAGTTVRLAAFHQGHQPATVTVSGETMRVDATKLPHLAGGRFYEVWLTDKGRTTMWPLGAIGEDNRARLPVPSSVMGQYSAIEVSVQQPKQTAYSGVSVLRGSYG